MVGAFVTGLVAAVIVLAGALISLPYWPEEARTMWRGQASAPPPAATPAIDLQAVRADATVVANAAVEAAKRELTARLDDLEKRVRAAANTAARRSAAAAPDQVLADLRSRLDALENRPAAAAPTPAPTPPPVQAPAASGESDKDVAAIRLEIATLRAALQALDQAMAGQKDEQPASVSRPRRWPTRSRRRASRPAHAARANRRRWAPRAPRR